MAIGKECWAGDGGTANAAVCGSLRGFVMAAAVLYAVPSVTQYVFPFFHVQAVFVFLFNWGFHTAGLVFGIAALVKSRKILGAAAVIVAVTALGVITASNTAFSFY